MTKQEAIEHFGSVSALAEALEISTHAISQWGEIPELRQFQIEVLTGGALKALRRVRPAEAAPQP